MYYRKHQPERLPDALIQKFTQKKQHTVYIWTVLSLRNLWRYRKKNIGVQEETPTPRFNSAPP